jgi:hypothetical protein
VSELTGAIPNQPSVERKPIAPVKIADPQFVINYNSDIDLEASTQLSMDMLGARELVQIVRNDLVKGQGISYSPIKNLSRLAFEYSPEKLVALQGSSRSFFESFPINLNNYVPPSGTGPGNSIVYIDPETGDLVINLQSIGDGYQVEVEILKTGELFDGTIYLDQENVS